MLENYLGLIVSLWIVLGATAVAGFTSAQADRR